jgi:signal peptidase I
VATEVAVEVPASAAPQPRAYSNWRLFGGFVGRTWLWFLAGCLAVTLLPLLFGWRPYVVESGSMAPRIKVGDVILAAPEHDPKKLLGRVTVFHDPDLARNGEVKSHRVVQINADGSLTTKGDANQSVDSVHLQVSGVIGLGRLLVRWVGLPLIWAQNGQWLQLGLLATSIFFAALLVMRDVDPVLPEDALEDETDDRNDGGPPAARKPRRGRDADLPDADLPDADVRDADVPEADVPNAPDSSDRSERATAPPTMPQKLKKSARVRLARLRQFGTRIANAQTFAGKLTRRTVCAVLASLALVLPAAHAAFSATTFNTSDSWNVGTFSYTTETNNLGPYLYWKLDDLAASTTAADSSGNGRTGTYNSTFTKRVTGATPDDTTIGNFAVTQTNAAGRAANTSCIYTTSAAGMAVPGPMLYSEVIWFKTTSNTGGKLIGLENNRTGISDSSGAGGQYDRMLYMDPNGVVWFGVWTGAATAIRSVAGLNDGTWHMAAATMSTTTGMTLYIDGKVAATNANTVSETETKASFWRVGCGNLAGWGGDWTGANAPTNTAADNLNYPFNGSLDEATVWLSTLTTAQISFLYFVH